VRQLVVLTVILSALVAVVWMRPAEPSAGTMPRLSFVTTAHQLGVVGYRDPVGVISPDGTRVAYTEGRFIRVVPIAGGSPVTLAPGEGQVRYLAWASNDLIVAEDATPQARWWTYRVDAAERSPLWNGKDVTAADASVRVADLRQLAYSTDGKFVAALMTSKEGPELWKIAADGSSGERRTLEGRPSFPAFAPNGEIACLSNTGGGPRLSLPCGAAPLRFEPDLDVYGPIAFAPDNQTVYFASPNDQGMVELWSADPAGKRAQRLTSFTRDAYAPSVSANGVAIFKVQSYRTVLADVRSNGGATRQLTTFQSETPSYHPTKPLIAFTYGTWRRVTDDIKYPDIAQEIGVIGVTPVDSAQGTQSVPVGKPLEIIADSDSEDQAMAWSPNGKWIAYHSHKAMSDDVWLRPADMPQPDQRITFLGRGAEVGWPRWSPDGRTVLLNGARKSDGASVLYTIGVNQDTGALTTEVKELAVSGVEGEMGHSEWLPDSATIVSIAKEGPGRHVIFTVPVGGGRATVVHRVATEHDFSGLGVSPDGRYVGFAAPAPDGYYQIFKKAIVGDSSAIQLTRDPSHKTQPAWSPDGSRIAFTVWSYDATFYSFANR